MTPWFDKYTRPHWVGVYETRTKEADHLLYFNYWNGLFWERVMRQSWRMTSDVGIAAKVQHIEWRGFTSEQPV